MALDLRGVGTVLIAVKRHTVILALLLAPTQTCLPAPAQASAGPVQVKVAVYLLGLGRLGTASGSFTADFYISFRCDRPCDIADFEFMNGRATLLDKQLDGPTHKDYRVQAALQDNFDLRRYTFDGHDLSIALEHKLLSTSELVYVPDRQHSGVAPDVVVTGWQLHPGWDAQVGERYFPTTGKRYSDFAFRSSARLWPRC